MKHFYWIVGLAIWSYAANIHWWGDYEKARMQANQLRKPLWVLIVKKEDSECRIFLKNLQMNNRIVNALNRLTIPVLLTKEYQNYPLEMFYATDYPTLYILNSEEKFIFDPIIKPEMKRVENILERMMK